MGMIKKLLLIVLVVVAGGAAVVWGSKYIPAGKLDGVKQATNQVQPFIQANIQRANTGQLGELTGQVTYHVQEVTGKVLGAQTSSSASGSGDVSAPVSKAASLPQRTFELARYGYCKEVVKEFESRE